MRQISGLLLIDKPKDLTSHDVVARLRKILKQKAIGHTGTLDPLATGLMVIVLGDATKLSDYLMAEDKAYHVDVRFGVTTDTLDRTGKVLSETSDSVDTCELDLALAELEGDFEWPVPLFSAAKVNGKKLYEHGRAGEEVEVPTKQMTFWNVERVNSGSSSVEVKLECSKGSFVRTWVSELGHRMKTGAIVEELRRTRVGAWRVENALTLEELHGLVEKGEPMGRAFIPMGDALPGLKAVMAGPKELKLVENGQIPRDIQNRLVHEQKQAFAQGRSVYVKVVDGTGDLLAILVAEPGQGLKIRRVFRKFA